MARIFITGSADGLGHLAAKQLVQEGHKVVLHARDDARGKEALAKVPGAETVLTGDLSDIHETKELAKKVNEFGNFDAVIHNAGVYQASGETIATVNTLTPYILTSLIHKPQRLIYLSSGMHLSGQAKLKQLLDNIGSINYSDSKLHIVLLTKAVARLWPDVYANAVNPGWVPTKMGGAGAPDSLEKGYQTQCWLATSEDAKAKVTGKYFYHQEQNQSAPAADDETLQDEFLKVCEDICGLRFPEEN